MKQQDILEDLKAAMTQEADEEKKIWFEKYLRYEIRYRGVVTPKIKHILVAWRNRHQLASWPSQRQLQLSTKLWRSEYAEDKFAATLYIQLFLLKTLDQTPIVDAVEKAFAQQLFYDWSTVDWLCIRILAPLARRSPVAARRILNWQHAEYLWQARAALVPFTASPFMSQHCTAALAACDTLIQREERFAKTAVGWFLRVLSKHSPAEVMEKLTLYQDYLTPEVMRNATKYNKKQT